MRQNSGASQNRPVSSSVPPLPAAFRLLPLTLALGCAGETASEPTSLNNRVGTWTPDPSATVLRVTQSGLDNPRLVVIGDRATWVEVWTEAWQGMPNPPRMPEFDFVLTAVVVVGVGRRAGPDYTVTIDSIVQYTAGATLFATESQPGTGCDTSSGASAPVHIVHMPGHPPVTEWRVGINRHTCP